MEGLNAQKKLTETEKELIRRRVFAKQRQQALGVEVKYSEEELALIQEDLNEDFESKDWNRK